MLHPKPIPEEQFYEIDDMAKHHYSKHDWQHMR